MKRLFVFFLIFISAVIALSITYFLISRNLGKGALQATSEPNSKVYLDGKLIGQTPLCRCELPDMIDVQDYTIRLVPVEGNFPPFEQKISIYPKVLTVVDRTFSDPSGSVISLSKLQDKKEIGLTVISFPQNAKLFLDNSETGVTPFSLNNITESDHEIKLTKNGYKDKIIRIRTVKGYKLDALIFLGVNAQVSSSSATPAASVAKIIILDTPTGFLRVREEASLSSSQVGQVLPGEKYDLLEEKEGWFKIKTSDTKTGWISSQYSKKER